ncbi:TPA: phage holin, partial [Streptococcus agalactiae]|nr:phage holin [Streptococcus agalactiae]
MILSSIKSKSKHYLIRRNNMINWKVRIKNKAFWSAIIP